MNYLKKILTYALPYKKYAFLNIICNMFYALFGALSFVAFIPMLDILFNPEKANTVITKPVYKGIFELKEYVGNYSNYMINEIAGHDKSMALVVAVSLVISLFLLKNIFGYLGIYYITFLRNGVLKDLRDTLYTKVIKLPISFFSEKRKGDIMARISNDVNEVQNSFLSVLELIVKEPLTILFAIIVMMTLSVKLSLFVFIFIPVSGFIISAIGKRLKKHSENVQKEQGIFISTVDETLNGLKVIKGFNAEKSFLTKFKDSTLRFFNFSNQLGHRQNLASPTSEFLGIVTIAILLWFGGRMVLIDKTLNGATFIAFLGLAYQILTPAKAISKASYSVKRGNAAAHRVLEVIETENPLDDIPKAIEKTTFNDSFALKNITFKYEDEVVLKNFSLHIPKGKVIALVGQSGSGKSTIANLVTRFYDVNEGEITIDNINIKNIKKYSLRHLIGLVTQDSILFNDTVKNNILLGKENATEKEIIEALKIANAWEFVSELPKGIHTNIGDSGNKLSGGQKQRLSIARAVLKNPPIMVLDEATSALDTESEKLVQNALENMMRNRTSIVIAHRLSTIQNADLIVVMKKGEIVEQGTHQELINKKGMYKNLVEMQSLN